MAVVGECVVILQDLGEYFCRAWSVCWISLWTSGK